MANLTQMELDANRKQHLQDLFGDILRESREEIEVALILEFVLQLARAPYEASVHLLKVRGFEKLAIGEQYAILDLLVREYSENYSVTASGWILSLRRKLN